MKGAKKIISIPSLLSQTEQANRPAGIIYSQEFSPALCSSGRGWGAATPTPECSVVTWQTPLCWGGELLGIDEGRAR